MAKMTLRKLQELGLLEGKSRICIEHQGEGSDYIDFDSEEAKKLIDENLDKEIYCFHWWEFDHISICLVKEDGNQKDG